MIHFPNLLKKINFPIYHTSVIQTNSLQACFHNHFLFSIEDYLAYRNETFLRGREHGVANYIKVYSARRSLLNNSGHF